MKNSKLVFSLFFFLISGIDGSVHAQAGPPRKRDYIDFPFTIDSAGSFQKCNGALTLGTAYKEGVIKNKGEKVAGLDGKRYFTDSKGKIIGKVSENGNFYSNKGKLLYSVRCGGAKQCEVMDSKGNVIAKVHEDYKLVAGGLACCLKNEMFVPKRYYLFKK
ncbi:MAG: hypothetical protein ACJ75J_07000 [Cytophagaceae bacterium]